MFFRMEAEILEATTQELMMHDYPSDCCPEGCYLKFPCIAGDPDSPFWQGWGNLRIKTFRLIENKYFETAVITMILISSLALVMFCYYYLLTNLCFHVELGDSNFVFLFLYSKAIIFHFLFRIVLWNEWFSRISIYGYFEPIWDTLTYILCVNVKVISTILFFRLWRMSTWKTGLSCRMSCIIWTEYLLWSSS